jgi:hypothetical protein
MSARNWTVDTSEFRRKLDECRAAVDQTRRERNIDPHHDSGADSGALSEDEERERSERSR